MTDVSCIIQPNTVEILGYAINSAWLPPGAIFFSVCVALYSVWRHNKIAKQRATLDVITKTESEPHFLEAYETFLDVRENKKWDELSKLNRTPDQQKIKNKLDDYLNHYEFVAISIEKNILDEGTYKSWMKTSYMQHFEDAKKYIEKSRKPHKKGEESRPDTYKKYENLVKKWKLEDSYKVEKPPVYDKLTPTTELDINNYHTKPCIKNNVLIDDETAKKLKALAKKQGATFDKVVNDILKKNIEK